MKTFVRCALVSVSTFVAFSAVLLGCGVGHNPTLAPAQQPEAVRQQPARPMRSVLKADPTPNPTPPTPGPTPAPAPPPVASIKGPLTAAPDQCVWYDGSAASGGAISWAVFPTPTKQLVSGDGTQIMFAANPPYVVAQAVVGANGVAFAVVQVGLPQPVPTPTPPPTPTPIPPPQPTPTAASLWLVVIDDDASRTAETAAVLSDANYWATVEHSGDHSVQVDNKKNPEAAKFAQEVTEAGGLPCLVIMDAASHKVLNAVKLPATTAGVDALRKQYHGQ